MPSPLHPAVVHFPIVLGVLLPVVVGVALWATIRSRGARGPWLTVVVVSLALMISAWVAQQTGEAQEDVVEAVVSERAIHEHEEMAEGLLLGSALAFLVIVAGLAPGRLGQGARVVSVVAYLSVVALAYRVGHSGGDLVYEHGAGAAYAAGAPGTISGISSDDDGRERGERRDHEDREGEHR